MDYIKDNLQSKEHTPSPNVNLHTMLCNRTHQLGQKKNNLTNENLAKISFVAGPLGVKIQTVNMTASKFIMTR